MLRSVPAETYCHFFRLNSRAKRGERVCERKNRTKESERARIEIEKKKKKKLASPKVAWLWV